MKILVSLITLVAAVVATATPAVGPLPPTKHGYDDAVVLIESDGASGSGVTVRRPGHEFIWTAAHVVAGLEKVETVVDPATGKPRVVVSYKDAKAVRQLRVGDVLVGEDFRYAEVVRYSDLESGYDLALLRTRASIAPGGAVWADRTPATGAAVYHVGSPGGRAGYNSYIPGSVSFVGRPKAGLRPSPDDAKLHMVQYSLPVAGGSSGGPVFHAGTGRVTGLVTQVMKANPTIAYVVPVEVVRKFAREADCVWAVDPEVPVPPGTGYRSASPRTTPLPLPSDWKPTAGGSGLPKK